MAATPEGKIKKRLDDMLKAEGVWYFSPQAGPYGRAGIPDRIAIVGGLFVGIECKADKTKRPTALQRRALESISKAGGHSFVVFDDETIDAVRKFIRKTLHVRREEPQGGGT